jgi:hypothetical protein
MKSHSARVGNARYIPLHPTSHQQNMLKEVEGGLLETRPLAVIAQYLAAYCLSKRLQLPPLEQITHS